MLRFYWVVYQSASELPSRSDAKDLIRRTPALLAFLGLTETKDGKCEPNMLKFEKGRIFRRKKCWTSLSRIGEKNLSGL